MERGRLGKAAADVDILVEQINLFQVDNDRFPTSLDELITPPEEGRPYISDETIAATPWKGQYVYTLEETSYTIQATDSTSQIKYTRTINF